MKNEILKLIAEEEKAIRECDRCLVNVDKMPDARFQSIMTAKATREVFVAKLKFLLTIK